MRLLYYLLFALCLPLQAAPLALTSGNDYAPFADQDLPGGGLATRVVRAVFERLGEPIRVDWLPWKRGYALTLEGRYAATFPYIHSPEREALFHYSEPIFVGKSYLYTLKTRTLSLSEAGLRGRSLCVPLGWSLPQSPILVAAIHSGAMQVERPADLAACAQMVRLGRADAFNAQELIAEQVLLEVGLSSQFQRSAEPVMVVELALIAAKQQAGSAELVARFNQALRAMREDGSYQRLLSAR
ncbi:substrate-binding periplasmic protein [Chitinimonas taiwanensis]|uniref:Polar amino acid transport system substrate-binding protein n=1 Tax=Chitinimonas taiwanensis DSM 18899 TaxID=1121279 RepID=A0A1K2HPB8_9NEIS|nr:transporter substrate-binding domain-containing protein [Chitinimonas taiwanensis]SFZ78660.1 polar amino acid transport system substrate-binding protein [Chitinimonas taiwanensis DSM 18899]